MNRLVSNQGAYLLESSKINDKILDWGAARSRNLKLKNKEPQLGLERAQVSAISRFCSDPIILYTVRS
jgi:hypothetical protein